MDPSAANLGEVSRVSPGSNWTGSLAAWKRFLLVVAGLAVLWALPLSSLARLALKSDIHSHVLLVPIVSAYVLWTERLKLPAAGTPARAWAFLFGGLSMVAMGLGQAVPGSAILSARILGFVFATQAAAAWFLGTPILRAGSFAFGFLVFMVPLPGAAIDLCETQLQHASAVASEWLFLATGVAHIRDGQFFQLPGITIEVAQECSGFRSTLVLLIVSVVAARMFLLSTWRRLALVLVIIPLGILRNGFRIWVLAVLTVNVDSRVIDSPLHHQGGPIFFVLSLGPLFGFLWLLYRMERSLRGDSSSASVPN